MQALHIINDSEFPSLEQDCMRLFRKANKKQGWLAIAVHRDGLVGAAVRRAGGGSGLPAVAGVGFLQGEADPEALARLGAELGASGFQLSHLLGNGHYQLLTVDSPNVAPDELRTAVRWRLKDMLDFHVDDATIDVFDIPVDKGAAVRPQQTMFAVAARNSVIGARQRLFEEAKLALEVIDIPEMAQRNISARLETEGRGLAMLSVAEDGALLTVSHGGELYLARRIDVPLELLTHADIERRHGGFDRIALELQRSLDHFERQFSFVSVARLLLAPSPADGLEEYLSSNLYIAVDQLDLASVFDLDAVPALADKGLQHRYFLALGAALRHEELLP